MHRATFTHATTSSRPPHEVWLRLQEAETWSAIGPVDKVWDPTHDEEGNLVSYQWSASVGPTSYDGSAQVVEAEQHSLMVLDLDGGEIAGALNTAIEPRGDGSLITVTLRIVSKGMLAAMFFPLVSDTVRRGLPEQVDRFVSNLEAPA